ncbi:MAG: serine dehydratase subunit alpha family protein [Acholeplasmataceae bacterium]|nr:serine dehydratase subunit alpha family protein [Acholeplasmataceae bacterium]
MSKSPYETEYLKIIKEELVPALGCTEPIAVAFAAAKCRELLGCLPDKVILACNGGLIKNISCVVVPNTGNLVGIEASALAGIVGGDSELGLEVLTTLAPHHLPEIKRLLKASICEVRLLDTTLALHFTVMCQKGGQSAEVEIKNLHTNITTMKKNGKVIFKAKEEEGKYYGVMTNRNILRVDKIIEFAELTPISILKDIFSAQVEYNMQVATDGIENDYGVSIGKAILENDKSLFGKIKAYSAAASEARMCGSILPVITNSGSGNQGIAASVPVILYAREKGFPEEKMFRALAVSNLLTIYQKSHIGRLSAFCGAVSAACGAGAAITYLEGGDIEQIKMTITNALANVSGIVCDGAKNSCSSKIASGLEAAFIGHFLAMRRQSFNPFSGVLRKDADDTISAVGRIATDGMKDTDRVILEIMLEK